MIMKEYSIDQIKSLRFYQGNTDLCDKNEPLKEFYSTPQAYRTVNALMYPGIKNEKTRVLAEKKKLSPHLLYDILEVVKVYENIFSLMKDSMCPECSSETNYLTTYRTERRNALDFLSGGSTVSLTSTSKIRDMGEYFKKKEGLVLLEFKIPMNVPYVDVNEVLGTKHSFSEQQEILLPPFLKIKMLPKVLTEVEQTYRDVNGNPPVGKYEIIVSGEAIEDLVDPQYEKSLKLYLTDKGHVGNAIKLLENLNACREITEEEITNYIRWKKCFCNLIKIYYQKAFG